MAFVARRRDRPYTIKESSRRLEQVGLNVPPAGGVVYATPIYGMGVMICAIFRCMDLTARSALGLRIRIDGDKQAMPIGMDFYTWWQQLGSTIHPMGEGVRVTQWDTTNNWYTIIVMLPLHFTKSIEIGFSNSHATQACTGYVSCLVTTQQ